MDEQWTLEERLSKNHGVERNLIFHKLFKHICGEPWWYSALKSIKPIVKEIESLQQTLV